MIVQIYETTTPQEAAWMARLGVDHIGVLVGPGQFPREVGVEQALEIFAACGGAAKKLALTLSHDLVHIGSIVERTAPDVLHLGTPPDRMTVGDLRELKRRFPRLPMMRTIPVVGPESVDLARSYDGIADWLLLDTHLPGEPEIGATGQTHDWSISREIVAAVRVPAILAGGLGPENVVAAIRAVAPAGVDSKTRTDGEGGRAKDPEKVRRFFESAKGRA
jgi:phosphoribosylanthranilate isomerase